MTTAAFDIDWCVKTLTASGMPEPQALAVTALLRQSRDLDLSLLGSKSDIAEARADLLRDIVDTRADLAQTKADLLRRLAETESGIVKWMIGAIVVAAVVNAAAVIGALLALVMIFSR